MHEASELIQVAAPIASAGGLATVMGLLKTRKVRRVRVIAQSSSPRDAARIPITDRTK